MHILIFFLILFIPNFFVSEQFSEKITKDYSFEDFDGLRIGHTFEIKVAKGAEYKISITGEQKYFENIDVNVNNHELVIDYEWEFFSWGSEPDRILIEITMPILKKVQFGGASKSFIAGFEEESVEIEISGASESEIELDSEKLLLEVEGASKAIISGECRDFELDVSGASSLDAYNFKADNIKADLSGASNAKVYAIMNLKLIASGASSLEFGGDANVTEDVSGASVVKKIK